MSKNSLFRVSKNDHFLIRSGSVWNPKMVSFSVKKGGGKVSLFGSYQTPKIFTNFFLVLTGHFLYIYISSGVSPTLAAGPPSPTYSKMCTRHERCKTVYARLCFVRGQSLSVCVSHVVKVLCKSVRAERVHGGGRAHARDDTCGEDKSCARAACA